MWSDGYLSRLTHLGIQIFTHHPGCPYCYGYFPLTPQFWNNEGSREENNCRTTGIIGLQCEWHENWMYFYFTEGQYKTIQGESWHQQIHCPCDRWCVHLLWNLNLGCVGCYAEIPRDSCNIQIHNKYRGWCVPSQKRWNGGASDECGEPGKYVKNGICQNFTKLRYTEIQRNSWLVQIHNQYGQWWVSIVWNWNITFAIWMCGAW